MIFVDHRIERTMRNQNKLCKIWCAFVAAASWVILIMWLQFNSTNCAWTKQERLPNGKFETYSMPCCDKAPNDTYFSSSGVFYLTVPSIILKDALLREINYELVSEREDSVCDGKSSNIHVHEGSVSWMSSPRQCLTTWTGVIHAPLFWTRSPILKHRAASTIPIQSCSTF